MRIRLRDFPTQEQLAELYKEPHDYRKRGDHVIRASVTSALGVVLDLPSRPLIADLSCGNAIIPTTIAGMLQGTAILGDYAPGYNYTGPIEETLGQMINDLEDTRVDLFICSETLEHLEDPDAVLRRIRDVANMLLISTPEGEAEDIQNPGHIWAWNGGDVCLMLDEAGWDPMVYNVLDLRFAGFHHAYQIWVCKGDNETRGLQLPAPRGEQTVI